jgi:hypothetical protein
VNPAAVVVLVFTGGFAIGDWSSRARATSGSIRLQSGALTALIVVITLDPRSAQRSGSGARRRASCSHRSACSLPPQRLVAASRPDRRRVASSVLTDPLEGDRDSSRRSSWCSRR